MFIEPLRDDKCYLLDMSRNSVGHILADIAQEAAHDDRNCTESNTDQPDIPQTISISPPTAHTSSLEDLSRNTRDSHDLSWLRQQDRHEFCCVGDRETSFDGEFADVGWQTWCEAVDKDVVVDCVADAAADCADSEGQSDTGCDCGIWGHRNCNCGCWDKDAADAEAAERAEGDCEFGGFGGEAG